MLRRFTLFLWVVCCALLASCGEDSKDDDDCDRGSEGCRCTRDDSCDEGLSCRSDLCVDLGTGGGAGEGSGGGCPAGQLACGAGCVVSATDNQHCGACNVVCLGGSSCVNGQCACTVGELCGNACVNTEISNAHCGECGNACAAGESCVAGQCSCLGTRERCGDLCVETSSSPEHCGACDIACATNEVCSDSVCADGCADGLEDCQRSCVDLSTSEEHCGACDAACGPGMTCETGVCTCANELSTCDGECVDTNQDANHCGACGAACGAGQDCVDGQCACSNGGELCGDACVDVPTNPAHCGACGHACDEAERCDNGECVATGGTGGNGGSGGSSGSGGDSGSGASGGVSGSGGSGGSSGSVGSGGGDGGPPVVLILLQRTSGMFQPAADRIWDRVYSALMDPDSGAVTLYEDRIRFGFETFRGPYNTRLPETDPLCAEMTSVAIAEGNRDTIDTEFQELTALGTGLMNWETPTGHVVGRSMTTLAAYGDGEVAAGQKHLLLITNGPPNTCQVPNPQCGQDLAIKAVQDAYSLLGLRTLMLGVGEEPLSSGCPSDARCGLDYLQDMANAGLGLGVAGPGPGYQYEACPVMSGGLLATYGTPGAADYYYGVTRDEIHSELVTLLDRVLAETP